MARGPKPAHGLLLYSPGAKNVFLHFQMVERKTKEDYSEKHEHYMKLTFPYP